jgi:hypothetical protein
MPVIYGVSDERLRELVSEDRIPQAFRSAARGLRTERVVTKEAGLIPGLDPLRYFET